MKKAIRGFSKIYDDEIGDIPHGDSHPTLKNSGSGENSQHSLSRKKRSKKKGYMLVIAFLVYLLLVGYIARYTLLNREIRREDKKDENTRGGAALDEDHEEHARNRNEDNKDNEAGGNDGAGEGEDYNPDDDPFLLNGLKPASYRVYLRKPWLLVGT